MISGFDNPSLAVFTTLAPAGVVALIIVALARIITKDHEQAIRLDRIIALPFATALVGFIASATHLGTPANALHVFAGVGASPLSNEVLSVCIFLLLAGSYWMYAFKLNFPDSLAKIWLAAIIISGGAFLFCTSQAYAVQTVPTWNTFFTPLNIVISGIFTGCLLALVFLTVARGISWQGNRTLIALSLMSYVADGVVLVLFVLQLSYITNNEFSAISLIPDYPIIIGLYSILGFFAIVVSILAIKRPGEKKMQIIALVVSCVLALLAVFISRVLFYSLHMTVGF